METFSFDQALDLAIRALEVCEEMTDRGIETGLTFGEWDYLLEAIKTIKKHKAKG